MVHQATGPTSTSQYEHSSICATVKKVFNLPNFLTARDAWAGTFEGVFTTRTTPRTDCPGAYRKLGLHECTFPDAFIAKVVAIFRQSFSAAIESVHARKSLSVYKFCTAIVHTMGYCQLSPLDIPIALIMSALALLPFDSV